jgi:CHAD domain-containing protein
VASGSRGRKLERIVQRLTRALGTVRELDVALMTLDELERGGETPRSAITRLRQVIGEERRRLHAEMCRRVEATDLHKLQKRAVAAARKAPSAAAKGRVRDPERLALARQRAGRRAVRLRGAIENAAGIYLPDRLHEVRIAVKKLRYSLELARELSGSRAMAAIRMLKEAQDLLGRMHDLEVLIARTRAMQGSPIGVNLRLSGDLDRVVRRLENECRQQHGHYMALRHKLLALGDRVEADAALSEAAEPAA